MIQADNLAKRFENFTAVDNGSFKIGRAKIVGHLVHNGAGKNNHIGGEIVTESF